MMMKELMVRGTEDLDVHMAGYREGCRDWEGEQYVVIIYRLSVNCVSGNGWSYITSCHLSKKYTTEEKAEEVKREILHLLWKR